MPEQLVFVSYSARERVLEELGPNDSLSRHQHRLRYAKDLTVDLEGALAAVGLSTWIDRSQVQAGEDFDPLLSLGLAECSAAIMLLNSDSLASTYMRREATVLLWRAAVDGLVVLPVLLADIDLARLRRSDLSLTTGLDRASIFVPSARKQNAQARQQTCNEIVEALLARLQPQTSGPTSRWIADMAHFIREVPDHRLTALAELLHVPAESARAFTDLRRALSAALLGANVNTALRFMRTAVQFMDERSALMATQRVEPIWVDVSSALGVIEAADRPNADRLVGFVGTNVRLGEHVVARATLSSEDYATVSAPDVFAEFAVQDLVNRYDQTIRLRLNIGADETPEEIEKDLSESQAAVFVLLRCGGLRPETTRAVVHTLQGRFPGICIVLLAEEGSPLWEAFDLGPVARWTEAEERVALKFSARLRALVEGD
jgi:hypothetical protein